MKSVKGQAALEFMMTYGWAILVVLAAIGALSYFGILDPSRFTPSTCMASSGFSCDGKPVATTNSITFTISNGQGFDVPLNVTALDFSDALKTTAGCAVGSTYICARGNVTCNYQNYNLLDGSSATVRIVNCGQMTNLNIVKGDLTFNYTNAKSALPESLKISVVAKPGK